MLVEQLVRHRPPAALQAYGVQSWTPLSTQDPLPLQVSTRLLLLAVAQLAATHCVPDAYSEQLRAPLHRPVVPHDGAS